MKRQTYHIKEGKTDFRPREPFWPHWAVGFEFEAVFHPSCWFSSEDVGGDDDRDDWLKLTGMTAFFSWNDHNAGMFAFRPTDAEGVMAVTGYTNDRKGNRTVGRKSILFKEVEVGQRFYGKGMLNATWPIAADSIDYFLDTPAGTWSASHRFDMPFLPLYRQIGTYWGGFNNSPGPYGGAAPWDASLELAFNWIN